MHVARPLDGKWQSGSCSDYSVSESAWGFTDPSSADVRHAVVKVSPLSKAQLCILAFWHSQDFTRAQQLKPNLLILNNYCAITEYIEYQEAVFSHDTMLVAFCNNGTFLTFDTETVKVLFECHLPDCLCTVLGFSLGSRVLAFVGRAGEVVLLDVDLQLSSTRKAKVLRLGTALLMLHGSALCVLQIRVLRISKAQL